MWQAVANLFRCSQALSSANLSISKLLVIMLSRPLPRLRRRASADFEKTNGPCGRRFANLFRSSQALNFANLSIAKLLLMMLSRPLPNLRRRTSADFAKTNGTLGRRFANPFRCFQAWNFANLSIAKLLVMMLSRPLRVYTGSLFWAKVTFSDARLLPNSVSHHEHACVVRN